MEDQFKIKWNNYLQTGGKVWPKYEFFVQPRTFNERVQNIEFTSLVPVGKNKLCPFVKKFSSTNLTMDELKEMDVIYHKMVNLIKAKCHPLYENTISDIRIYKPEGHDTTADN